VLFTSYKRIFDTARTAAFKKDLMKNASTLLIITSTSILMLTSCVSKNLRAVNDPNRTGLSNVTVIAHRGASAYAPENTLASFDKAQALGALACEADIQLSKDGQLVIFHDDTLDKKTKLKGPVNSHSWAELSTIDLAPWFASEHSDVKTASVVPPEKVRPASVRKVTQHSSVRTKRGSQPSTSLTRLILLNELFERYGMTFTYNLEIKAPDDKIPALALKSVNEYGLRDNVTFTSFIVDQLIGLRKIDKTIPLCYLIDDKKTPDINAEIQRAKTLGFNQVSVRAALVNADHVSHAKALNLRIISWGSQNDDDMKHAVQAGVDGLTTNWPDRLMAILQIPISR
jgi:glycerophosphoryl diester phosphodiesterase